MIDYGAAINTFDNIEDEKDVVIISLELFASNDGTSLLFQVWLIALIILCRIIIFPLISLWPCKLNLQQMCLALWRLYWFTLKFRCVAVCTLNVLTNQFYVKVTSVLTDPSSGLFDGGDLLLVTVLAQVIFFVDTVNSLLSRHLKCGT